MKSAIIYLIVELLKEFNLIHQRFNFSFQFQTRQRGIINVLIHQKQTRQSTLVATFATKKKRKITGFMFQAFTECYIKHNSAPCMDLFL